MAIARALKRLVQVTPENINHLFAGTLVENLYDAARYYTCPNAYTKIPTPAGEIGLTVPKYANNAFDDHEPKLANRLVSVCSEDTIFYDIGTSWGYYIALTKAIGVPPQQIYAFESSGFKIRQVKDGIGNPPVSSVQAKVGAKNRNDTITIDDYSNHHPSPTVVKVDVEGAETDVLRGMESTLREHGPTLFVEVHPQYVDINTICTLLTDTGYELEHVNHRDVDSQWKELEDSESLNYNSGFLLFGTQEH